MLRINYIHKVFNKFLKFSREQDLQQKKNLILNFLIILLNNF